MESSNAPDDRQSDAPTFRVLLGAHDPADPAEATLVLLAAAAFCGLRFDGELMEYLEETRWEGRPASMRRIAAELGVGIDAVRRGVRHLRDRGALIEDEGVSVEPDFLADRWRRFGGAIAIKLDQRMRSLGMRGRPLLLAGLVLGQLDKRGQLRLGVPLLAERTGFPVRSVERALATARSSGAIQSWKVPTTWQLVLAPASSRNGGRGASRNGGQSSSNGGRSDPKTASDQTGHCESAVTPSRNGGQGVVKRRSPHCESAEAIRIHQDVHQDDQDTERAVRRSDPSGKKKPSRTRSPDRSLRFGRADHDAGQAIARENDLRREGLIQADSTDRMRAMVRGLSHDRRSPDEIAATVSAAIGQTVTVEQVEAIVEGTTHLRRLA